FIIGGERPDWLVLGLCVGFTFIWAQIAAIIANKVNPKTLNRLLGAILVVLGAVIIVFAIVVR
ncbi:MAG: sulfite exporter TauE/SafE family protein, partial [Clostridia bacterium]|nr:sulfite exporter TauE/SafE family protein [Clostridia bacterium]